MFMTQCENEQHSYLYDWWNGCSNTSGAACRDIPSPLVLPNSTLTIRDKQEGELGKEDKKHLRRRRKRKKSEEYKDWDGVNMQMNKKKQEEEEEEENKGAQTEEKKVKRL